MVDSFSSGVSSDLLVKNVSGKAAYHLGCY